MAKTKREVYICDRCGETKQAEIYTNHRGEETRSDKFLGWQKVNTYRMRPTAYPPGGERKELYEMLLCPACAEGFEKISDECSKIIKAWLDNEAKNEEGA